MPVPTPGPERDAPPLVLQEISTQADLQAAAIPAVALEPRPGIRQAFRALRHRNFRLFVSGQIVSLVGTWMQNVAQAWLVYRLTHSELLLGTAWFCTQIPVFAFSTLGGLAADRYSRHRLVVITQTLLMLQAFALAALTLSGKVQVWHILALAVVLGTINAFDMPGRQSLIIQMTSKEDLLYAISLNSAIFNGARVIGPAVAGLVVAAFGEGICFLVNGVSFLAVIGCLLAMRLPKFTRRAQASPWEHLAAGFKYVHGHRPVRRLLGMMGAVTISGMPAVVLMPVFAEAIFHRGSRGLGILMGAMGSGAVAGTLVLAWRASVSTLPRVIFQSALLTGAGFCFFAWSKVFYLSLAVMPLIGYGVMRQLASANTLIQTLIPDEFRGRTMAFYTMTVVGLGPAGSLAAGALAHAYGARLTVAAGGVVSIAAALIFGLKLDVFRKGAVA
ncbi:MAG: MFS transporter [Bryobacteraceae bacterium]